MTRDEQIAALRSAAGLTRMDHVARVRCTGKDAARVLSRMSTRRLFLREGQMAHTLFLRDDGRPIADAYIASAEDGAYYVLAEGLSEAELVELGERARAEHAPGADAAFEPLSGGFELLSVNGPYAWELMEKVCGPAMLGMPYLTLMHLDDGICFRAGKTGEYGYDVLVEREALDAFEARLLEVGPGVGLARVDLPALDQCALDNWHFNVRALRDTPLAAPLTPIELQLQWRVHFDAEFIGADAVRARRAQGIRVRATCFSAPAAVVPGDAVLFGDRAAGEVLAAGWSPVCGAWTGVALLALPLAHPRVHGLRAVSEGGEVSLSTRTPPFVNNRSLHVDPHRHAYRTRESDAFPPLVVDT